MTCAQRVNGFVFWLLASGFMAGLIITTTSKFLMVVGVAILAIRFVNLVFFMRGWQFMVLRPDNTTLDHKKELVPVATLTS